MTDAQGNFVRNLTKDDFEVLEDGKPQDAHRVLAGRHSGRARRTRRCSRRRRSSRTCATNTKEFNGRVYVLVLDDLHTRFARSVAGQGGGQAVHRALPRRQRHRRGRSDRRRARRRAGVHQQPRACSCGRSTTSSGRRCGPRRSTSSTTTTMQRNIRAPAAAPRDLSEAERAHKARNTLATLRKVADYLAGIRGRRKARRLLQRRHRLRHHQPDPEPLRDRRSCDEMHARDRRRDARQRQLLRHRSARPDDAGRRGDRDPVASRRSDARPRRRRRSIDELRSSQDSLRDHLGRDRRLRRRQPERLPQRVRAHRPGQQQLLRARLLPERHTGATAASAGWRSSVKRPGLTVRARRGYVAPNGQGGDHRRSPTRRPRASLREALDSPIPISGLGLSVFAAPLKGHGAERVDRAGAGDRGPRADVRRAEQGTFADDVEVACCAVDRDGKIKDGGRDVDAAPLGRRPTTSSRDRRPDLRGGSSCRRADTSSASARATAAAARSARSLRPRRARTSPRSRSSMSGLLADLGVREPDADRSNPDPEFKDVAAGAADRRARLPARRHARVLRRGLRQPVEDAAPGRHQGDDHRRRRQGGAHQRRTSGGARSCRGQRRVRLHDRRSTLKRVRARPLRLRRRSARARARQTVSREVEFRVR